MSESNAKKRIRQISAGIMIIMVVLFMALSAFFIAAEAGHCCHCKDDDCPVCACLQLCERTLNQMGAGLSLLAAAILPASFFLFAVLLLPAFVLRETLVSRKIRIND